MSSSPLIVDLSSSSDSSPRDVWDDEDPADETLSWLLLG